MYRGPKPMKWSMCIMPRSSLPTPATLERVTLNRYARTTETFFQYATQQSTKLCYVSCVKEYVHWSHLSSRTQRTA